MKVRIGLGAGALRPEEDMGAVIDSAEAAGIDSVWFPESVSAPQVDPVVGIAYAASRTRAIKLGSGLSVLPGRHPVLVAKQLASLASLAPGRILPVFGLQPARPAERAHFLVPEGQRGAVFDESLVLLRLLLERPSVTFDGAYFSVRDAGVGLLPGRPLDLWVGGTGPAALRRAGRLADGWLGSLLTPGEAAVAIAAIQDAAARAGREVDTEHFGMSFPVALEDSGGDALGVIRARRPGTDAGELLARGWAAARELIERHVAAGVSKFVVRPASPPMVWERFLADFTRELGQLQT